MHNSGSIYETKDGRQVIAMNDDQLNEDLQNGKVKVEITKPANLLFPELNEDCRYCTVEQVLMDKNELKLAGFLN